MIDVKKGSLWYRLALYGVFFEEEQLSPNLCPFMRRVLLGMLWICIGVILGAFLIMALGTPFLQLFMVALYGSAYLEPNTAMIIGSCIWFIVLLCVVCWFFADTDQGMKVRTIVSTNYNKLHIEDMLLVQWVLAMHHKMCPHLEFSGHTEDANIMIGSDIEE